MGNSTESEVEIIPSKKFKFVCKRRIKSTNDEEKDEIQGINLTFTVK